MYAQHNECFRILFLQAHHRLGLTIHPAVIKDKRQPAACCAKPPVGGSLEDLEGAEEIVGS
jgi:hypothetical protein